MDGRNVRMNAEPYSVDGTIFDYGALLILPISELFMENINFNIYNSTILKPITNFSMGYSLANFGDEIYVYDQSQADPISRTARLGYTFEIGTDIFLRNIKLNLFKYSFSAEANDILIERISGNFQYQSGIGDINFSDHLINLKKVISLALVGNTAMLTLLSGRNYGMLLQPSRWMSYVDCIIQLDLVQCLW